MVLIKRLETEEIGEKMGQVPEKVKGGELQSIGGGIAPLMW